VRVRNAFGSTTSANAALAVVNVAAWGDNQFGQLNAPWDLTNVVAVTADHWGSLALKADKSVIGWGSFMSVPSSWTNVMAITPRLALRADGTVVGWGSDWAGGSGVALGLSNMVAIASTDSHCLAARSDGTVSPGVDGRSATTMFRSSFRQAYPTLWPWLRVSLTIWR